MFSRRKSTNNSLLILLSAGFLGIFLVGILLFWQFYQTNFYIHFGSTSGWKEQVAETSNISFRYPSDKMEVIVPQDQIKYPVSVVKKGERGESVLIQLGTWNTEVFNNLEDAVKKYQSATSSKRQSEKIEELIIDGRGGVLFVQNENSGRRILEALIWDPVPTGQSENSVPVTVQGSFVSPGSAREISLQLPGTATANDRILYEKLYREILNSIKFIKR